MNRKRTPYVAASRRRDEPPAAGISRGCVQLGADGTLLAVDERAARLFARSRSSLLGAPLRFFLLEAEHTKLMAHLRACSRHGRAATALTPLAGTGGCIAVRLESTAERDHAEGLRYASTLSTPSAATETPAPCGTEQALQRALTQAEEARNRLEAVMEALPVGVAILDEKGGQIRANREFDQIWREPRPVASCVQDYQAFHARWLDSGVALKPEDWASAQAVQHGQPVIGQLLEITRFDGTRAFVRNSAAPVRNVTGEIVGSAVAIMDISDGIALSRALRESEQRFQLFMDHSPAIAWIKDEQGRYTYLSHACRDRLGIRPEDWLGKSDGELWPAEVAGRLRANDEAALAGDRSVEIVEETVMPQGQRVSWLVCKFPFRDAAGNRYVGGIGLDISGRRLAEQALQWSARRHELLSGTATRLLESDDPSRLMESLCRDVMDFLDCQAFFNFLVDEAAGRLRLHACAGIGEEDARRIEWLDYGVAVCGCVARDGERILAEDILNSQDVRTELVKSYGIQAYCCHPLLVQRRLIGTLSFGTRSRSSFNQDEIGVMKAVADLVAIAMNRIATEQALRASTERYRALSAASSEVFYRMSSDWSELRQLSGRGFLADTSPNQAWLQTYIEPDDRPRIMDAVNEAIRSRKPFEMEHRVRQADGSLGWTFSRAIPILDADGNVTEWFGAASDITKRKKAEEAMRDADRRKDEFLAVLAHELRNPLAPLRNALYILQERKGGDALVEQLRAMMARQVDHLVRLVDDLLDVSRFTRGKIELKLERVELAAVVRQALETSQPLIHAGGHTVTVSLPPEPLCVHGDPVRLAQVLSNLLNNAAKYMDKGGSIHLAAARQGGEAIMTVRDAGMGIPAGMLPRVFDLFTQVDRTLNRTQGGLGIGLALVRALVELHGGRVEAHSEGLGRGSEFVIHLPLDGAVQAVTGMHSSPESAAQPHLRVLVVDDNRDAAESLGLLLKTAGMQVRVAYEGRSALEILAAFQPQAVVLDLGMPGMDGLEVARHMRRHPQGRDLTLIALTGWGQIKDRRQTRQAGFDHHLIKPVDFAVLKTLLGSDGSRERSDPQP